jgi:hypothetical protein
MPSPILTRPPIISTINRIPHRRKSGKIKRVPQINDKNPINLSLHEDNTVSIDDLPLGERTSPNKTIQNNIQTNLSQTIISTPIKKKPNTNKKKYNYKRQNNIVGVAVIEERRVSSVLQKMECFSHSYLIIFFLFPISAKQNTRLSISSKS